MITLITGGPGLGKTALAVKMLSSEYANRPVFTNIKGLTLLHAKLPLLAEWTKDLLTDAGTVEHHFAFPPGSVLVIDECQSMFPNRSSGSQVPPHVAALATHRHEGLDIVLITQGSALIDSFARSQVKGGLHIFLHKPLLFRFRYERGERINEDSKAELALCSRRKYKVPKEAFPLYKSAELHTKPPKAKIPMAGLFLAVVVLALPVVGWAFYTSIRERISGPEQLVTENRAGMDDSLSLRAAAQPPSAGVGLASTPVPDRIQEAMTPLDDHNPLSAPLYAAVLPPVVAPEVVGCIASRKQCRCYTQQSTPLWLPEPQCRLRAAGEYFDPYKVAAVDTRLDDKNSSQNGSDEKEKTEVSTTAIDGSRFPL